MRKISFLFIFFFVLAGCAGARQSFVRPSSDTFKLGQTTYSQILQHMGEPKSVRDIVKNGKNMKCIYYTHTISGGEPLEEGCLPARQMAYYFHNDTLVSQQFTSSFKSDHSNFDDTRIGNISKGQTTRTEVIQLLGKPSGSSIPPMVRETSGEAIVYKYINVMNRYKISEKALTITFDDRDRVLDIDYSSSVSK